MLVFRSTSAIPTAPGSATRTRTPTGCCASTSQRAPTSARTARTTLQPWRLPSTAGLARPLAGKHLPRRLTGSSDQPKRAMLRRPLEPAQMPAQRIDDLGPLPHQEIAGPEHESCGLGLLAFGSHKAHGRALGGLADRLGIRGIVLLPLDERLDVRRRDQPDRMPEHANLARPIMGAAAGLHGDCAGGLGRQERANLAPPQPLAEHNRS